MIKHRRRGGFLTLWLGLCLSLSADDGFVLIRDGAWLPQLVLTSAANAKAGWRVRQFSQTLQPDENGKPPQPRKMLRWHAVEHAGDAPPRIVFAFGEDLDILFKGMDIKDLHEGFAYRFLQPNLLVVGAGNGDGLNYALSDFQERFLNRRWLFPGEAGWSRPLFADLAIPRRNRVERPAFRHRKLSGLLGPGWNEWGYFNRTFDFVDRHHALNLWLPPEQYNHRHNFFPEVNGKRMVPADNSIYVWQPCLHAEGLLEEVVNNIRLYLDCHPHKKTVSLAVNDTIRWCMCEHCAPFYEEANSIGLLHTSELYYPWVNQVVEEVLVTHPDTWFGLIAYANVHDPPQQNPELHPRIIPFLTYERLRWLSGQYREVDLKRHRGFRDLGVQVGWYDYIYGTPYLLPRPLFHQLADLFRTAAEEGVAHFYLEIYPNFGEGPKPYLVTKLLWDPTLDVDAVLRDWYVHAVGAKAADDLAAYFAFWERYWYQRVPGLAWFHQGDTYLYFQYPDYMAPLTHADIKLCDDLMAAVVAKAETPEQQMRAHLLHRAYQLYRANALSFLGLMKNERLPGETREDYLAIDLNRYELMQETLNHPFLFHPLRFDHRRNLQDLNWGHPNKWRDDRRSR